MNVRLLLVVALSALTACGDDDGDTTDTDMGPIGVDMEAPDLGPPGDMAELPDMPPAPTCEGDDALDPIPESGFLVVSSDFSSTAIGVVTADGSSVDTMRWIDSGTTAPGLVAALSGDVVLPTVQPALGAAIIDRSSDTVTRFCRSGALVGQVRVGTDTANANPQDALFLDGTGWVSRYEPHPTESDPQDQGSDLLGLDADAMTRNDMRVDLSEFGGTATGLDGDGAETEVTIAARPQSIVRVGDIAVVGLDRLPVNLFGTDRGHLPGAVALVALASGEAELHEIDGLANCGTVTPVPGDDDQVLVACGGYADTFFGDTATERTNAGLARLTIADGEVSAETVWRVSDSESNRFAVRTPVALDENRVLAIAWGVFGESGDELVVTELDSGDQEVIDSSTEAFAIGQPARLGDVLLVPDASADAAELWRFTISIDGLTADGTLEVDAAFPPRAVYGY